VVDNDGNDERQSLGVFVLLAVQFPDFNHVAQDLQRYETIGSTFVFEQEIDKSRFVTL
jgi:hypothetical protein